MEHQYHRTNYDSLDLLHLILKIAKGYTMKDACNHFEQIASMTTNTLFAHLLRTLLENPGYGKGQTFFHPGKRKNYVFGLPKGNTPKLALVAHIDTVGAKPPEAITNRNGLIFTTGGGILGADDRAGVTAILRLIEAYQDAPEYLPAVYFCNHEESGCGGAKVLAETHTPPESVRLMLELDRANHTDFVTYSCESKTLDDYVSSYGFIKAKGSCSDISHLMPAWKLAAANVSIGYYGQHTSSEYLVIPQMLHTTYKVEQMMLKPPPERIPYETAPVITHSYVGYSGYITTRKDGQCWDAKTQKYRWWNRKIGGYQDTDPWDDAPEYDPHITQVVTTAEPSHGMKGYDCEYNDRDSIMRLISNLEGQPLELGSKTKWGAKITAIVRKPPYITEAVLRSGKAANALVYNTPSEIDALKTRMYQQKLSVGNSNAFNGDLICTYVKWSDGSTETLAKTGKVIKTAPKIGKAPKKKVKTKTTTEEKPNGTLIVTHDTANPSVSLPEKTPESLADTQEFRPISGKLLDNPDLFADDEICIACNRLRPLESMNPNGTCDQCLASLAGTPYDPDSHSLYEGYFE